MVLWLSEYVILLNICEHLLNDSVKLYSCFNKENFYFMVQSFLRLR